MDDILFVNLSDIHTSAKNHEGIFLKLKEIPPIIDTLKKLKNKAHVLILVSGDIAFSGKDEEYGYVADFFEKLKNDYNVIICGGNHDHDFSIYRDSETSRNTIMNMEIDSIDDGAVNYVSSGMNSYRKFEIEYSNVEIIEENSLCKLYRLRTETSKVNIVTMNTAWCSKLHEKGGDIRFPTKNIILPNEGESNILMFHHPLSWFEPNNGKAIRNLTREKFSIILTGHEHLADSFKIDANNSSTLMIESLPVDDSHIERNGFMVFEADNKDILITSFFWDGDKFTENESYLKSDVVESKSCLVSNNFEMKDSFCDYLQDLGVDYIHPEGKKLKLDNIYVYPKLRDLSEEREQTKRIHSESIINDEYSKVVLIGDEFGGKTALLKKLYSDAIHKDMLVLLLDGEIIKKTNKNISKILNDAMAEQYVDKKFLDFSSYDAKKILFIDNFSSIKGDVKSLKAFLSALECFFSKIIVTIGDDNRFVGVDIIDETPFSQEYKQYQILKFGYRLRYDLANRWNSLKEECQLESTSLLQTNDAHYKMINTIIGKNYIPSTPFFLLTMLQSIDNDQSADLKTSSYGYYYQFLITSSLGTASVKKNQLDELFNYITELSYHFYENKIIEDTKENLWNFNVKFCNDYAVQIDFGDRFELLSKAKIVETFDGSYYKFRYNYIYYFFIAKYFADHLREENVIQNITLLIETLHLKESMNIIMFLTHHTKDEYILNSITKQSAKLFSKYEPATIDLESEFINSIIDNLPEVSFVKKDRLEFRRGVEDVKDENFNSDQDSLDSTGKSEDKRRYNAEEFDLNLELNLTIKSLELLGQLSRNYYGSLKVPQKELLLKEAINAPLRSLSFLLDAARTEPDKTIDALEVKINEAISGKNGIAKSNIEIRDLSRKILFRMIFTVTFSIVSKIASAIGSSHLQQVIDKVCDDNKSDAGKLIKLASMLEVGQMISTEELRKLNLSLSKNHLSELVVKALVVNYLYMFERPEKQVQKICEAVDIKYSAVSKDIALQKITKV